MDWIELTVEASAAVSEAVSNILLDEGAGGVLEASPGALTAYFPADEESGSRIERIRSAVEGLGRFGLDPGTVRVKTRPVREDDWAHSWKEHFLVQRIGKGIIVRPTWREYDPRPGECVIHLDPGMAFGTGGHPTTALCLEALEEELRPGDRVYDVGTGSGILAIAAVKLGAADVVACDIDPVALRVAEANLRQNGVEERVTLVHGSWRDLQGRGRIVVANIVAEVICAMAVDVCRLLEPGGRFIASGIVREREEEVLEALTSAGMEVERLLSKGEWTGVRATWPGKA